MFDCEFSFVLEPLIASWHSNETYTVISISNKRKRSGTWALKDADKLALTGM